MNAPVKETMIPYPPKKKIMMGMEGELNTRRPMFDIDATINKTEEVIHAIHEKISMQPADSEASLDSSPGPFWYIFIKGFKW